MQFPEDIGKAFGKKRPEGEPAAVPRMRDRQTPGMKENAVYGERGVLPRCIDGITDEGMSDVAQVDANLVGSAGQKVALDQRETFSVTGTDTVIRPGGSSLFYNGHAKAIVGISSDWFINGSFLFAGETPGKGQVPFFDGTEFERRD